MNDLLNPITILQNSLMRLENQLVLAKYVSREFEGEFAVAGAKTGYTVNARIPPRFRGRIGDAAQPEAIQEQMTPISINRLWGQDLQISDQDLILTIDRFGERYLDSSSAIVANNVDIDGFKLATQSFNAVGTPGNVPSSLPLYAQARVLLDHSACPSEGMFRSLVINPDAEAAALGFNFNLYNPNKEISDQYRYGNMGQAIGWKWSKAQNVGALTIGNLGASPVTSNPTVSGNNQTGGTLLTTGWDASQPIFNGGEIITLGTGSTGTYGVNPLSFVPTGHLRQFTVTGPVSSDGSGNATIPINPPISNDVTSPFQTVVALPTSGAALYVFGQDHSHFANIAGVSSPQNIGFHKQSITLAVVKQDMPGGCEWSEQVIDPKMQLAMRLVRQYLIGTNEKITRLDVLGGWSMLRPEWMVRIVG